MKKKNWFLVSVIIIAVLLIATVLWIYAKRIEDIENKIKGSPASIQGKVNAANRGNNTVRIISASLAQSVFETKK